MVGKSSLLKIEQLVRPEYDRLRHWAHAWPHVERVAENARKLAGIVRADPVPCQIAAYCHDLGRIVEESLNHGRNIELGDLDHALYSIEKTVDVLRAVGISGYEFDSIVGAVAVHSDKLYYGKNLIAKVLRDADKKESLGPWGILRMSNDFYHDIVDAEKILKNKNNQKKMKNFAEETLKSIKGSRKKTSEFIRIIDFSLEWIEERMMDTSQGYSFVQQEYEYTRKAKEFLKE